MQVRVGLDNDLPLDYDEIVKTICTAEVLTFRFAILSQRLLIDYRSSDVDPPMVKLVPRAGSVEERFRSLKKLRPRFRLPEKISAISWPKGVETLVERGVWDAIVRRMADRGCSEAVSQCTGVLEELRALERQELCNAIEGEEYRALWEK